jgi:hypothetical protein
MKTGRLGSAAASDSRIGDLKTVLKAATDHGCLMELNCQPSRLDLDDVALMAAKEHGIPSSSTPMPMPWRNCPSWNSASTRLAGAVWKPRMWPMHAR